MWSGGQQGLAVSGLTLLLVPFLRRGTVFIAIHLEAVMSPRSFQPDVISRGEERRALSGASLPGGSRGAGPARTQPVGVSFCVEPLWPHPRPGSARSLVSDPLELALPPPTRRRVRGRRSEKSAVLRGPPSSVSQFQCLYHLNCVHLVFGCASAFWAYSNAYVVESLF